MLRVTPSNWPRSSGKLHWNLDHLPPTAPATVCHWPAIGGGTVRPSFPEGSGHFESLLGKRATFSCNLNLGRTKGLHSMLNDNKRSKGEEKKNQQKKTTHLKISKPFTGSHWGENRYDQVQWGSFLRCKELVVDIHYTRTQSGVI